MPRKNPMSDTTRFPHGTTIDELGRDRPARQDSQVPGDPRAAALIARLESIDKRLGLVERHIDEVRRLGKL